MRLQHEDAHGVCRVTVEDLLERIEVTQALRHFLLVNLQHACVHPHVCQWCVPGTHGLGGLVLMMRKNEVGPTAVYVYGRTEIAMNHGTALGVPARTSLSPWTGPTGFARLRRLPQRKVEGISLLVVHLHALAGTQLIEVATREHAV